MLSAVVILGLAVATLAFISAPLLRSDAAESERISRRLSEASELQSRHDMLIASLKDVEDDRATGKLDDEDYAELQGRLRAEAVDVLRKLDQAKQKAKEPPQRGPRPVAPRTESEA